MDLSQQTQLERLYHFLNGKVDILRRIPGRLLRRTRREIMLRTLTWTPRRRRLFNSISVELRKFLNRCGGDSFFSSPDPWRRVVIEAIREFDIQQREGPKTFLAKILASAHEIPFRPKLSSQGAPQKRLKILYVTGMFPSTEHGGGLRIFDILMNLSERHEIDLYSIYDPKMDRASFNHLRGRFRKVRLVNSRFFCGADAQKWLTDEGVPEGYYDVIHYEYNHTIELIDDLRRWSKKSIFVMIECLSKSFFLRLADNNKRGGSFVEAGRFLTRLFINALQEQKGFFLADEAVSVTPEDADFIQKLFGISSVVVPTGISDFAVYRPAMLVRDVMPVPQSVMFLGFYDHTPNIEAMQWYLRDVHPFVKAKLPNYKLSIVGAGNTKVLREEFSSDLNIEITGRVEDFVPYIANSKICISPLSSGAGIRGKINQDSAVGRPTVSTSIGVAGVNYKNQESVIVADSPEDFADGVIKLLTNEDFWKSTAENASVIAKRDYSWAVLIKDLEKIYVG
jgi:glycosyltransferase involved in cell wall biosynthesis